VIVGIGVDVVDVARFESVMLRTAGFATRVFTERELALPPQSLAGRFAAKEAVAKALGAPVGLTWHDCEVVREDNGRPVLDVRGSVAAAASAQGISRWHVSISHDGGLATAYVVAESTGTGD
jgi:holo-[acyl-carrier protein] synthase